MNNLLQDESGQSMTEYALILALIAVVVIITLQALGHVVSNTLNHAAGAFDGSSGSDSDSCPGNSCNAPGHNK